MDQSNPSHTNSNPLSNDYFMKEQQISYNTFNESFSVTENDVWVPPYTTTDYEQSIPSAIPSNEHNYPMQFYPTYEPYHNVNEQNTGQIPQNLTQNVHNFHQINHFRFEIPGFEIIVRPNNNLDMQNQLQDYDTTTYWNSSLVQQEFQRHQQQFPQFYQQQFSQFQHQQFSQFQNSPDLNNSNELIPITNNINFNNII
ncbi:unnamed protein product [Rhizophagus irregularis]|nr:unnamed protein product [Rhizophagus irregularis]